MKNKLLSIILALAMVVTMSAAFIYGTDIDAVRREKSKVGNDLAQAETELKEQQKELDKINAQVDEKQKDFDEASAKYEQAKVEAEKIQESVKEKENNLGQRLRTMYKNGSVGFVDVILESDNVSEFLSNISFVQKIYKDDQKALKDVKSEQQKLEAKKEELKGLKEEVEVAKTKIQEKQKVAEKKKSEMKANRDVLQKHFNELAAAETQYQAELEAWQRQQDAQAQQQQQQINSGNQSTGGNGTVTPPANGGSGGTNPGGFIWPTTVHQITSGYGWRTWSRGSDFHLGIDISGPNAYGQPVYAAKAGTVAPIGHHWSYGNAVTLYHGGGFATRYAHMSAVYVSPGQSVSQGQMIGRIGNTGNSSGPHLHFEVRINGQTVNPLGYL